MSQTIQQVQIGSGKLSVTILTLGAIIHRVHLDGVAHNLTCAPDDLDDYQGTHQYHGALVGPIANRINPARIRISGMMYELERNERGETSLHSGTSGTHGRIWQVSAQSADSVTLTLNLADGACDLPAARTVNVTYSVTAPATLTMSITAETDGDTAMNFANHSYWNLDGTPDWSGHTLTVAAETYLPLTPENIPTGEVTPVAETPLDFRMPREIHAGVDKFDHNLCLSKSVSPLRDVAKLTGQNGVTMTMATTAPGLQAYDGGGNHAPFEGIALEPQHWPNAPHNFSFPSIKLAADETYTQTTQWRFSV